ncbi:MAG: hypothetical protein MSG64_04900 [Pyrinomonadaceae bacterium MAG19_C2-C3]|nr:hypothetical protein [Pyrinomonadaceae bacterium MAG19_C2-C3]
MLSLSQNTPQLGAAKYVLTLTRYLFDCQHLVSLKVRIAFAQFAAFERFAPRTE